MSESPIARDRPQAPNIQIYRPQLTSVLSIANRISGAFLSLAALGLVAWLAAAAAGPQPYAAMHDALTSWIGEIILFAAGIWPGMPVMVLSCERSMRRAGRS